MSLFFLINFKKSLYKSISVIYNNKAHGGCGEAG